MVTIATSLNDGNTFYIFRATGQEVKIVLTGNGVNFSANHKLTPEETIYIRENIL